MLPTEKSKIETDLSKYVFTIYGRPKIGKSPLCACFDKPIFLATEPRLKHLSVHKIDIINWMSPLKIRPDGSIYGGYVPAVNELLTTKHDFNTIITDTYDRLVDYATDYICNEKGISHPSDMPHGKGWHLITHAIKQQLGKIASSRLCMVLTAHAKQVEIETKRDKFHKWSINVGGKNGELLLAMSDFILFMDSTIKDKEELGVIRTKSSKYYDAGTPDLFGHVPAGIGYPIRDVKAGYDKLMKLLKEKESKK